jgi:hypothetical protein
MFAPNPTATFGPQRPLREDALNRDHTIAYVVNRQRIVERETSRILAERAELASLQGPAFMQPESIEDAQGRTQRPEPGMQSGMTVKYARGSDVETKQASFSQRFASPSPFAPVELPETYANDALWLSDYALTNQRGTYWVSERNARLEDARREAAKRARKGTRRSGRVAAPCYELDLLDRMGEPIALPCESKEQAARVHPIGKDRTRCLARIRKVLKRERDAQAANAYQDAPKDAERVVSAVATNATSWDVDH